MKWIATNQGFSEVFTPDGTPRPHDGRLVNGIESFARDEIDGRARLQTLSLVGREIRARTHDWTRIVVEDTVVQPQQPQRQAD